MRRILLGLAVVLALPAPAQASRGVTAFYYPWYGTSAHDGTYEHWSQDGHAPPNDIASAYYPALGLYSSADQLVIAEQMDEIRSAGITEIAVSWWGRGSVEDARLLDVVVAARAERVAVAVHIEPYEGRTVASIVDDIAFLKTMGISTLYVYHPLDLPVQDWAAATNELHAGGMTLYAQTALVGAAAEAGFDGVYTYDILTYGGSAFRRLCAEAHARKLLCAPSFGPGYNARRGDGDPRIKPRRNGATYDSMWRAAIASGADSVTITSFN